MNSKDAIIVMQNDVPRQTVMMNETAKKLFGTCDKPLIRLNNSAQVNQSMCEQLGEPTMLTTQEILQYDDDKI